MPDTVFLTDRIEVTRPIPAPASAIFDIVRSPAGHVAIDASGMLQDFTVSPFTNGSSRDMNKDKSSHLDISRLYAAYNSCRGDRAR